jgi:hypothetical protein
MAGVARMPRSRGGVSGVLLILLGAWGGLAPFVGPYFRFAYTPDRAWAYTSGRLWLSIVPGAAALVGGVAVTFASHRGVGIFGAVLAALAGAWFIVGVPVTTVLVVNPSISPGTPLARSVGSISVVKWQFFEGLGFFTATGILILFFGALALGRFSVVGVRDAALAESGGPSLDTGAYPQAHGPDLVGQSPGPGSQYPAPGSQYPTTEQTLTEPMQAEPTTQAPAGQPYRPGQGYTPPEETQTPSEPFPTMTSPFRNPPSDTGPARDPGSG